MLHSKLVPGLLVAGMVIASVGTLAPAMAAPVTPTATAVTSSAAVPSDSPLRLRVRWNWRMPANIVDRTTFVESTQTVVPGPDGIPDDPLSPVPGYPEAGNAKYGDIPSDGRFKVLLDAGRSVGVGRLTCDWLIKSKPRVKRVDRPCVRPLAVRLPEGTFPVKLTVHDRQGSKTVTRPITVKNVLMAITGDSYASGEGFPPFHTVQNGQAVIDWDEPACQRSRWSGFVRSALAVEEADRRSNVTLVDVACAGAQVEEADDVGTSVSGGMLSPQQKLAPNSDPGAYMPAQVDQLRAIAGNRNWDVTLLSIGGNDVGLSPIVKTCYVDDVIVKKGNCYMLPVIGTQSQPLHEVVDTNLGILQERYARLAPCFGTNGGSCETVKVVNNAPAASPTASKPVVIDDLRDLVHAMYPDLTQQPNGSGGLEPCTIDDPVQTPLNPIDNTWVYGAIYKGRAGVPIPLPTNFPQYQTPNPNPVVPDHDGLLKLLQQNHTEYGWRLGLSLLRASHPHGVCAADRWEYGITDVADAPVSNESGALHPNDEGQAAYEDMLGPLSIKLAGLPVKR